MSTKSEPAKPLQDRRLTLPVEQPAVAQKPAAKLADGTRRDIRVQSHKGVRIATRCETVEQFIASYQRFCEDAAIFIPNARRSVGAVTAFSFDLVSGGAVLAGLGTVVEEFTTTENRFGRPGIVVELQQLGRGSATVLQRVLAARKTASSRPPVENTPAPIFPKIAPIKVDDALKARPTGGPASGVLIPSLADRAARPKPGIAAAPASKPAASAIKVPVVIALLPKRPEPSAPVKPTAPAAKVEAAPAKGPVTIALLPKRPEPPAKQPLKRATTLALPIALAEQAVAAAKAQAREAPKTVVAKAEAQPAKPPLKRATQAMPIALAEQAIAAVKAQASAPPPTPVRSIARAVTQPMFAEKASPLAAKSQPSEPTSQPSAPVRNRTQVWPAATPSPVLVAKPDAIPAAISLERPPIDAVPEPFADFDTMRDEVPFALRHEVGNANPTATQAASGKAALRGEATHDVFEAVTVIPDAPMLAKTAARSEERVAINAAKPDEAAASHDVFEAVTVIPDAPMLAKTAAMPEQRVAIKAAMDYEVAAAPAVAASSSDNAAMVMTEISDVSGAVTNVLQDELAAMTPAMSLGARPDVRAALSMTDSVPEVSVAARRFTPSPIAEVPARPVTPSLITSVEYASDLPSTQLRSASTQLPSTQPTKLPIKPQSGRASRWLAAFAAVALVFVASAAVTVYIDELSVPTSFDLAGNPTNEESAPDVASVTPSEATVSEPAAPTREAAHEQPVAEPANEDAIGQPAHEEAVREPAHEEPVREAAREQPARQVAAPAAPKLAAKELKPTTSRPIAKAPAKVRPRPAVRRVIARPKKICSDLDCL